MFDFLKLLKKSISMDSFDSIDIPEPNPTAKYAPNTKISYDQNLTATLTTEHRQLLTIYRRIGEVYAKQQFSHIPDLLIEFKDLLTGHLLKENVSLYAYMKYNLQDDSANFDLMQSMQTEMTAIGQTVFRFIKAATVENIVYDDVFKAQFDKIGLALIRRIQNEENMLYPIYCEPEIYTET